MKVRLRLQVGPRVSRGAGKNRHLASAVASLLWPAVLTAYSLALWALAAQLKLTGDFGMEGVFSHWQVWGAIALLTHFAAMTLSRYGKSGDIRVALNFLSWFTGVAHRRETEPRA
jgi:hypothetical protein